VEHQSKQQNQVPNDATHSAQPAPDKASDSLGNHEEGHSQVAPPPAAVEATDKATPFARLQKNPPRRQDASLYGESSLSEPHDAPPRNEGAHSEHRDVSLHAESTFPEHRDAPPHAESKVSGIQHPQSMPAIPRSVPRTPPISASAPPISLHGELVSPPLETQQARDQLEGIPTITSFPAVPRLEGIPTITSFPAVPRPAGSPPAVIGGRGDDGRFNSIGNRPVGISQSPRKKLPIWTRVLIGVLVVLIVLLGGGYWYYQVNYAAALNNIVGHSAIHGVKNAPNQNNNTNNTDVLTGGRMNILLLGSDNDTKFGAPLAQTDIIVTIDPQTNYVGMLSIPRDMQVQDPVTGETHKLDEVFADGWSGNNFADRVASAAGRSIDTIQANFGIPINHYAWVGLQGFAKVIDTVGGIDIDATHPMVDDLYPYDVNNQQGSSYDYTRLYIAPGPQHMNGEQALDYVRTRHADQAGDFGRSVRQQQVLSQLKNKLDTPNIISQISQLAQDLNGSVETDLTLTQLVQLGNFARGIDSNKIDKVTFSPPFYSTGIDGTTNLAPICDQILPEIQKMFGTNGNCVPQASNGAVQQGLATTTPRTSPLVAHQATPGSTNSSQSAQGNAVSISVADINPVADIRDMLDLVFLITFESPDAAKV
jgi:LCP family protein required for cell wall assembly